MVPYTGDRMSNDANDPADGAPLRLHTNAATAPPDAETIDDREAAPPTPIRLVPRDRNEDIARADEEARARADALATSRVVRTRRGTTGTGLKIEDVCVVDHEIESLRTLEGQLEFVRKNLAFVDLSSAPFNEEDLGRTAVTIMERCEQVNGRDWQVLLRVLGGTVEPEPHLFKSAIEHIAAAHNRWAIKQLSEQVNRTAAEATIAPPEPESPEDLDARVLREAMERYDVAVDELDEVPDLVLDEWEIDLAHDGPPPPEPLLIAKEVEMLNALQDAADKADFVPIRVVPPARRKGTRNRTPIAGTALHQEPQPAAKIHAQDVRGLQGELWIILVLCMALIGVVAAFLMRADGQIRTASLERDAAQDEVIAEHTQSLQSHARTLARLVPVLAEKDAEIVDLTQERDNYASLAVESRESIQALDRRVGGQVGSLSRELSETRSELRREVDEQARQLEEMRAQLAHDQGDETPAP